MTKIKICGLTRDCDIEAVNELGPEYIGFVFAPKSRRYVEKEQAAGLRGRLRPDITAVGVFVKEKPEVIAELLQDGIIDMAQLHGNESEEYIMRLRELTSKPIIRAFRIDTSQDIEAANQSCADHILLDSGNGGTGTVFDWNLLEKIARPYFLAGGLTPDNVRQAIIRFHPYALDISSGVETNGCKDKAKMTAFVQNVRQMPLNET